jgi:hypothetical protein
VRVDSRPLSPAEEARVRNRVRVYAARGLSEQMASAPSQVAVDRARLLATLDKVRTQMKEVTDGN